MAERPWADDEHEYGRRMYATGASLADIAAKIGRTYGSVKSRRLRSKTSAQPWTRAEVRWCAPDEGAQSTERNREDLSMRPSDPRGRMHDAWELGGKYSGHSVPVAESDVAPRPTAVPRDTEQWADAERRSVGRASPSDAERIAAARRAEGLQRQLAEERARRQLAERETADADERSALFGTLLGAPSHDPPPVVPSGRASKGRTRAIPVLLCSDWHVEETVDPATIHGVNAYSPEIARRRVARMFRGFSWLTTEWAHGWEVRDAVIAVLGDLISGYIHEELVEGNALSPTEATLFAQELLELGLESVLEACPFLERVVVPCIVGNHGRTTLKPRIATAVKNSYEWLVYKALERRYAHHPRLQIHVATGAVSYLPVAGYTLRLLHGNQIRYNGGIGGLSIPLQKACDAWDVMRRADLTCLGHHHRLADYDFAVSNGSAIGYSPFGEHVRGRYQEPQQAAFLLDEEHGLSTGVARVYCEDEPMIRRRAA